jgi:hypothetical protein
MSAYLTFADDLEEGEVDVRVVYWLIFHKPSPDSDGGCSYDDLFWKRRDTDFDTCTFQEAVAAAKESLDEMCERDRTAAELLEAVGQIHEQFEDDDGSSGDLNTGVDLFEMVEGD